MSTAPTPWTQAHSFTSFEAANPGSPKPGAQLDTELNNGRVTTAQLIARLAEIQRSDGAIKNGAVHVDAFSSGALALMASANWTVRGAWLTATAYAIGDIITQTGATYVCAVAHTSGTFATDLAAVKWVTLQLGGAASGVTFAPAGGVAAATVQAAIEEVDSEKLAKASNLSDLASVATARANLGIDAYALHNYCTNGGMLVAQRCDLNQSGANALSETLGTTPKIGRVDGYAGYASAGAITAGSLTYADGNSLGDTGRVLRANAITLTGSAKWAFVHRIEAKDAIKLKSKPAYFACLLRHDIGSSKNAVVTISKPTAADDYTSKTQIAQSASQAVADGTNTQVTLAVSDMGDCSNGIEILVELDTGAITLKNIYSTEWMLVRGAVLPSVFPAEPFEITLARCQRYFAKTFAYGTAPAQNAGTGGAVHAKVPVANACVQVPWRFPVTMRATPTIVTFSPGNASADWWNSSVGGATANLTTGAGDGGATFVTATGLTVGEIWSIHAAAKSELF